MFVAIVAISKVFWHSGSRACLIIDEKEAVGVAGGISVVVHGGVIWVGELDF